MSDDTAELPVPVPARDEKARTILERVDKRTERIERQLDELRSMGLPTRVAALETTVRRVLMSSIVILATGLFGLFQLFGT